MTDQGRFTDETERFRRELIAFCYRMVGSVSDAEDLVQDAYLRAWRAYGAFERRASVRSWLYKIATNVCFTALESRRRRVLPSGLGGPHDGDRPPTEVADASWLEPFPDEPDPSTTMIARESLRLALIASLQFLPARQRAIFILRELVAFSAEETAELLDTSIAAVKSGLQRVRARLDELEPDREALLEPTDPRARELLDGYIAAFERADASLLVRVLRADATLEATPFRDWQAGRVGCIRLLEKYIFGAPGDWRMVPTVANGQPAAVVFRRDDHGAMQPNGIVVLSATATGVSRVVAFHHDPRLGARFC
ncbi:MAG TPA: RNA polymerase subunit sigma-70 [Kofleriaceae bacterium]